MTDAEFLRAFEECTLTDFHHRDHVHAAWAYLQTRPLPDAIRSFTASLKRFAASQNKSHIYHETLTWAWLLIIHERLERRGREEAWEDFARHNPDLFDRERPILERYYAKEALQSEFAKRVFVLPLANLG